MSTSVILIPPNRRHPPMMPNCTLSSIVLSHGHHGSGGGSALAAGGVRKRAAFMKSPYYRENKQIQWSKAPLKRKQSSNIQQVAVAPIPCSAIPHEDLPAVAPIHPSAIRHADLPTETSIPALVIPHDDQPTETTIPYSASQHADSPTETPTPHSAIHVDLPTETRIPPSAIPHDDLPVASILPRVPLPPISSSSEPLTIHNLPVEEYQRIYHEVVDAKLRSKKGRTRPYSLALGHSIKQKLWERLCRPTFTETCMSSFLRLSMVNISLLCTMTGKHGLKCLSSMSSPGDITLDFSDEDMNWLSHTCNCNIKKCSWEQVQGLSPTSPPPHLHSLPPPSPPSPFHPPLTAAVTGLVDKRQQSSGHHGKSSATILSAE
ncbi:uncharacterized protein LOC129172629 [Dunckerocampus dactyliophorus]|uniref:uncharacterized protein LOC129172629 n=1 Tax=Dunckerocampus dactyliophorus TaxID=161453 RepID=UPI0024056992|nr:uncharacterized protein LOC129172629 [Dunckerocampus dactyliophorus]